MYTPSAHLHVCRCPDGRVRLMCKGADGVVMERLQAEQKLQTRVQAHLVGGAACVWGALCL